MIVLRKTFWFESLKINKLKVWRRSTLKETEDPLRKTGEREKEKTLVTLGGLWGAQVCHTIVLTTAVRNHVDDRDKSQQNSPNKLLRGPEACDDMSPKE